MIDGAFMNSASAHKLARIAVIGTMGAFIGYMLIASMVEVVRYVKLTRR
jgi:hypothetical protein